MYAFRYYEGHEIRSFGISEMLKQLLMNKFMASRMPESEESIKRMVSWLRE
jgi:hypothetical protein